MIDRAPLPTRLQTAVPSLTPEQAVQALIEAAEELLPRDIGEIADAGRDYCSGVRDTVAALKARAALIGED